MGENFGNTGGAGGLTGDCVQGTVFPWMYPGEVREVSKADVLYSVIYWYCGRAEVIPAVDDRCVDVDH